MKTSFIVFLAFLVFISCENKSSQKNKIEPSKTDTILQKDGKFLIYNLYPKKLLKIKRDKTVYSLDYQNRIEKIVKYYLDKSTLHHVKFQIKNPKAKLGYSVEETDWEGVKYTQIGIFNRPEKNITTFQWLFYEPKSQQIYEFDVPKNKPILFIYK